MSVQIRKPTLLDYPVSFRFGEAPEWYVKIAGYPHNGIDFAMPDGVPIKAVDNGTVVFADNTPDSDGLGLILRHSWGISLYWHLSCLSAYFNQKVSRGDLIGESGHSGWASGPHLHFGIKIDGQGTPAMKYWVDPAPEFESVIDEPVVLPVGGKTYIVRPGDTLWGLSKKYYGDGSYWPKIYKANQDKIKNPNVIRIFQVLTIP